MAPVTLCGCWLTADHWSPLLDPRHSGHEPLPLDTPFDADLVGLCLDRLKHVKLRFIYGGRRTDSNCRPEFNDLGDTYLRLSQSVPCIPVTSGACGILIPSGSGNGDPRGNRTHNLLIKRLMPVVD